MLLIMENEFMQMTTSSASFREYRQLISKTLNDPDAIIEIVDMTGAKNHLEVTVKTKVWENWPLLKRHRLIYEALKIPLANELHALKIHAQDLS
jgi:stress-induced morphogen